MFIRGFTCLFFIKIKLCFSAKAFILFYFYFIIFFIFFFSLPFFFFFFFCVFAVILQTGIPSQIRDLSNLHKSRQLVTFFLLIFPYLAENIQLHVKGLYLRPFAYCSILGVMEIIKLSVAVLKRKFAGFTLRRLKSC